MSKVKKQIADFAELVVEHDDVDGLGEILYIHRPTHGNWAGDELHFVYVNEYGALETHVFYNDEIVSFTREVEIPDAVVIQDILGRDVVVSDSDNPGYVLLMGPPMMGSTVKIQSNELIDAIKQVKGLD